MYTYIHTYMYTYIHIYIYTYIHRTQAREFVIKFPAYGNGLECKDDSGNVLTDNKKEVRECNTAMCIHCNGDWVDKSACSADCSGGTKNQEYEIIQYPGSGTKIHTYIHIYIYILTYIHTYLLTYLLTNKQTNKQTNKTS